MILQLNPQIPVWVDGKGTGLALGWIDYSCEYHLMWIISFDDSGEIWTLPNPKVRLQKNITMGRMINEL